MLTPEFYYTIMNKSLELYNCAYRAWYPPDICTLILRTTVWLPYVLWFWDR